MDKSKKREKPIVSEAHHIIPKSLGGTNDISNIAHLTPREHFIAHAMLTKMVIEKKHKRSMAFAFTLMKKTNNKNNYSRIGNGKLYELLKISLKELYSGPNNPFYQDKRFSGKDNPFYGKKHSEETKNKLRNQPKKYGKDNPFYGKTHSDEIKKMISKQQKEPVTIIFLDGTIINFDKKIDIGVSLGVSKAMGVQLCSIKKHLWKKYNIKEIIHENTID
jgi:hypothetical protein